jgi:hypothetical protein
VIIELLHMLLFIKTKGSDNLDSLLLLHKGEGIVGFNASNISVISWRSVLLVDELEVPGEKYQPVASH